MFEIIKAKLINKYSNNTLAGGLELKKSINLPKIL